MRATIASLLFAAVAYAQQNAFNIPNGGYSNVQAGQSLPLSWAPSTGGTVTLVLRSGDSSNLQEGTEIASNIPNSGSYTWNVPSSITKGFTYTVQIISDHGDVNYTPYFAIDSTNTQPSMTSIVATGAPSGSGALPAVPMSLAAAESSVASQATTTAAASSAARSVSASASSASSMASMATASAASAAGSAVSSGSAAAASSTRAPNGAAALTVSGGLLAGLAGVVAWAL